MVGFLTGVGLLNTRAVALDISKAFYRVWHADLLHKLKDCVRYFLSIFYFFTN